MRVRGFTCTVLPVELMARVSRSLRDARTARLSELVIGKSLIVALVAQYDVFIGQLIRLMYSAQPNLLNSSDKQVTFSQLMSYSSIEQARDEFLEKEIESVLYKSREGQLEYLSKKGNIELIKHLDIWPRFLEVTERRNLFVHADGRVNSNYLNRCKQHGITIECKLGEMLDVSVDYFKQSYYTVVGVGLVVATLLWRKLQPSDIEMLFGTITNVVYYLILDEEYEMAQKLLEFARGSVIGKVMPEQYSLILLINQAQAQKWLCNTKEMEDLLNAKDWSVLNDKYRLAERVLREDFGQAAKLMKGVVISEEMNSGDFQEWPLFKEFRKSEEFKAAYLEIFGDSFDSLEESRLPKLDALKVLFDKMREDELPIEAAS